MGWPRQNRDRGCRDSSEQAHNRCSFRLPLTRLCGQMAKAGRRKASSNHPLWSQSATQCLLQRSAGAYRRDLEMTDIPNIQPDSRASTVLDAPDREIDVREVFGIDIDMKVPAFSEVDERVP